MERHSAEDDLRYVRMVVESSRRAILNNRAFLVLWGAVSVVGDAGSYGLVYLRHFSAIAWMWVGLYLMGGIGTLILSLSDVRRHRTRSFASTALRCLWIGVLVFVVGITSLMAIATRTLTLSAGMATTSACLGLAYFVTSHLADRKYLLVLSCAWWAASVVMFVLPDFLSPAVFGVCVLCLMVVPGLMLMLRSRSVDGSRPSITVPKES